MQDSCLLFAPKVKRRGMPKDVVKKISENLLLSIFYLPLPPQKVLFLRND